MASGLEATGLVLSAPDGELILDGADVSVPVDGRLWIEGAAGSGKRALLKVLAGLLSPTDGELRVAGIRLWPGEGAAMLRGKVRTGFAFPQGGLLSNQSLRENLALPLRFAGIGKRQIDETVDGVMDRLNLAPHAAHRPHALGGRARHFAQLARIELLKPELIFLSEPLQDLEGNDLALARALIQGWSEAPGRMILAAAEHADPELMPGAARLRLEAGRIHPVEALP